MEKFDSQFPVLTSAKGACCSRSYAACALEICFIFIYDPFSFVASSRSRFGITFYLFVYCFPPSWFFPIFNVCTRNVPEAEKLTGRRLGIMESGIIEPRLRASFGFPPWREKNFCSAATGGFTVVFVNHWSFWLTPGVDRKRSGSYTNRSIPFIHTNTVDSKRCFPFPGFVSLSDLIIINLCSWNEW